VIGVLRHPAKKQSGSILTTPEPGWEAISESSWTPLGTWPNLKWSQKKRQENISHKQHHQCQ